MRTDVVPQLSFGQTPIAEVILNAESRFELIPILAGLQHLYDDLVSRTQLLELIAADLLDEVSAEHGREGMSLWQVLVLAAIRQGCNYDYAALEHAANHDDLIRQFMETGPLSGERFGESTIHENVSRLRPQTLEQIAYLIAGVGHQLVPEAVEKIRGDSFVVQTNIHYPTDSSLLVDGVRKLTSLSRELADVIGVDGWRQSKHLYKKAKRLDRKINRIGRGRASDRSEQLRQTYGQLIDLSHEVTDRALDLFVATRGNPDDSWIRIQRQEILQYVVKTDYVASIAKRRAVDGETVPNEEKLFSLFESHTELIKRGKRPMATEFGHRVLVVEDAEGFLVHVEVMGTAVQDVEMVKPTITAIQERLEQKVQQASFDRGFWSPENLTDLKAAVEVACLPAKGHVVAEEQTDLFIAARHHHAGIESKIAALQHGNGQARCRDKGEAGYARYVMLGALARNLQTLGRLLLNRQAEAEKKKAA